MIEFVIAIIGVMLVIAGLLTVSELGRANTRTMNEASEEAITAAMGNPIPTSFQPISDWSAGADGRRHTKDDKPQSGSFASLRSGIVSRTAPNNDWTGMDRIDGAATQYDDIRDLNFSPAPSSLFGLTRGESEEMVGTLPVAQSFLGMRDSIRMRNEVWMPKTGGLY
jgi:hypothetical protein